MSAGGDYSKLNKLLLIAGLVYLLWPQLKQSFASLGVQVPDLSRLLPVPSNVTAAGFVGAGPSSTAAPGGSPSPSALGVIGGTVSSIATVAAGTTASLATIGIISGVGAVGVILAWGIIKQGWFRGGQEGVVVNPARDQYLALFAPLDPLRDSRNPPGFFGLAWLLEQLAAGQGGPQGVFGQLTGAHTKAQLESAVNAIQGLIAGNRTKVEQLWEYARRDASAPQRSVTAAA